jgi:hypothetical protein
MSLGENEAKLNSAIERNAFLESEQDESGAMVQRLKDEKRGEYFTRRNALRFLQSYLPKTKVL